MNCPNCQNIITEPLKECPHCNYVYDEAVYAKISFYFELIEEIRQLRVVSESLGNGLKKLSGKLDGFEKLLQQDLHKSSMEIAGAFNIEAGKPRTSLQASEQKALQDDFTPKTAKEKIPSNANRREEKAGAIDFELRVGQKWLLISGIIIMVFGVGYFLKFSFDQGWIGPTGQIVLAYVWGLAFQFAGAVFIRKNLAAYGLSLIGGGSAVLYVATFAASPASGLFNPSIITSQSFCYFIMILITILTVFLAIIYDNKWLAVLGIIGGFFTPILLSAGGYNHIALMVYMSILNFGLLFVAFYNKWDLLTLPGFIFTYLLYAGWFLKHYQKVDHFWPAIIFLNIFYLIYSIAPSAYYFFRKESEKISGFLVIPLNSLIAFGYSYYIIVTDGKFSEVWLSVVTFFYSAVFLTMAALLYRHKNDHIAAFTVLSAHALFFLFITVPIIASGYWITIFWAAQGILFQWIALKLSRKTMCHISYVLIVIALGKFFFYDYLQVFELPFLWKLIHSFYDLLGIPYEVKKISYTQLLSARYISSALLLFASYAMAFIAKRNSSRPFLTNAPFLYSLWGLSLFTILNMETIFYFSCYYPDALVAAISILWTMFSIGLMIIGFNINNVAIRKLSLILFLITIIKVFWLDISNFTTPYRILSFIVLGLILVGASYLYYRFKDRIINVLSKDESQDKE